MVPLFVRTTFERPLKRPSNFNEFWSILESPLVICFCMIYWGCGASVVQIAETAWQDKQSLSWSFPYLHPVVAETVDRLVIDSEPVFGNFVKCMIGFAVVLGTLSSKMVPFFVWTTFERPLKRPSNFNDVWSIFGIPPGDLFLIWFTEDEGHRLCRSPKPHGKTNKASRGVFRTCILSWLKLLIDWWSIRNQYLATLSNVWLGLLLF